MVCLLSPGLALKGHRCTGHSSQAPWGDVLMGLADLAREFDLSSGGVLREMY